MLSLNLTNPNSFNIKKNVIHFQLEEYFTLISKLSFLCYNDCFIKLYSIQLPFCNHWDKASNFNFQYFPDHKVFKDIIFFHAMRLIAAGLM